MKITQQLGKYLAFATGLKLEATLINAQIGDRVSDMKFRLAFKHPDRDKLDVQELVQKLMGAMDKCRKIDSLKAYKIDTNYIISLRVDDSTDVVIDLQIQLELDLTVLDLGKVEEYNSLLKNSQ